jgi:hypothetical protein
LRNNRAFEGLLRLSKPYSFCRGHGADATKDVRNGKVFLLGKGGRTVRHWIPKATMMLAALFSGGTAGAESPASQPGVCDVSCGAAADPWGECSATCGETLADGCTTGGCGCCPPRWTFSADSLLLWRSSPDDQVLYRTDFLQGGDVALNAADLDFDMAAGPRLTAMHHGNCWDVEFSYFQVDGFDAHTELAGNVFMVTDVEGAFFTVVDPVVDYSSRLYSGELNFRRRCSPWLSILGGYRMVELNERYSTVGTGANTPVDVLFTNQTFNHLYGFQVGADAVLLDRGRLRIDGLAKWGLYYNDASQSSRRADVGFLDESLAAEESHTSYLGEIAVTGVWQVTRRLALRAGYELLWLGGVATATDQIDFTSFGTEEAAVDTSGDVFYHGATVGMELAF